ncbi:MAG: hypothetical protein A2Y62_07315 [Candidatus Fischerbacteria bacterium RBG_13_37_8]|uniref:NADH:ubiquinone oxidoreductase intermediate-associated protein 30 domain-containing protein n=1 Tax=Candidatus Fischerbacteria bacterium RBG_13_37_8 TaxID=1817863 RepID=A0A1F5VIZ5_9BACT|nr:MAG: hypothetical protein A2Y62_07315 [Candidatus Fischerbacteria bacterium RBG_13_37_8]
MKKLFKIIFIILLCLLVIQLYLILSFHKEKNDNPLPPLYLKGAYHVHSLFSDGGGDIHEITRAASQANLDFVILTDHGRPNFKSSNTTQYLNNILLIGASEFSLYSGHMTAIGYKIPEYIYPPEPQEAINEIMRDKGICFISHPFDSKIPWSDWNIENFNGIEILNSYDSAKNASLLKTALLPLRYLFSPVYALTSLFPYPQKEMKQWDLFLTKGHYFGIYALDAHAKLSLSKSYRVKIPSYLTMFKILTLYIKTDHTLRNNTHSDAAAIISALRAGNFFSVIESLASANGFENYYLQKDGQKIEMGGSSHQTGGSLVFILPFPFATDIIIIKDGTLYKKIIHNTQKQLSVQINEPGVYRSELFISQNHFSYLPWITANPFFIDIQKINKKEPDSKMTKKLFNAENYFHIEKNKQSTAQQNYEQTEENKWQVNFNFHLKEESQHDKNFWTALARRENMDFSAYHGFIMEAKGIKRMRFSLQFRTSHNHIETIYQHTFLLEQQWQKITIPFDNFYQISGTEQKSNLQNITSFFILINADTAFPESSGTINIKKFGLY